jgi:tensin
MQFFKAGEMQLTTAASVNYQQAKDELPFCYSVDGSISFQVEHVLQGDILIRGRHLTASGQRVSMFRAAFHTGYVPPKVMRLSKEQLDGACADKRFPDDFFIDLIFEPCDAEMASQHLVTEAEKEAAAQDTREDILGGAPIITASAYDSMLHRDSRFWDVISQRRQEHVQHKEDDPMWGPTIGRKRDLSSRGDKKKTMQDGGKPSDPSSSLNAFSIGGDFDLFQTPDEKPPTPKKESETAPPKRDELMEALMALDDDLTSPTNPRSVMPASDVEDIVFFEAAEPPSSTKEPESTIIALPPKQETAPLSSDRPSTDDTKSSENEKTAELKETTPSSVDDAAAPLNDADLDLDVDLDALLASGADGGDDVDYSEDMGDDIDLFDDEDLEDLENLLSRAKK